MRRLAVALGALLVLGAACGEPTDRTAPGAAPGTLPIAPTTGAVPANRIDASALPEGFPREVWVHGDGRTVAVRAQEGGCGKASLEVKEQTASTVSIVLVETQPKEPQACTMDIRYPVLSVALNDPLEDRTVVLQAEQRTA